MLPPPDILLVEDDAGVRRVMRAALTDEGYRVVVATHGADVLHVLRTQPQPCLILLDLRMPVRDGWAFVTAQR